MFLLKTKKTQKYYSYCIQAFLPNAYQFVAFTCLLFFLTIPVFSQEERALTNQRYSSNNLQRRSDLPSNFSPRDSSSKERYQEYIQWIFTKINPLKNTAIANGFNASQNEISNRIRIFNLLYPNNTASGNLMKNEIIVQKYIETNYSSTYSHGEINRIYNELVRAFPSESKPSIEDLNDHLRLRVLLENPQIIELINKVQFENEKINQIKINKATETWEPSDLKIDSPGEECIAKTIDSNKCLLTVNDYNDRVRYQYILKKYPLDSARTQAVQNILTNIFINEQARHAGFANSDSANIQIDNFIKFRNEQKRFHGLGRPVTDERALWKAYGDFYTPLFERRSTVYLSLIGSSDSTLIDSLSTLIFGLKNVKDSSVSSNKTKELLSWQPILHCDLPNDLLAVCDTLRKNEISNIIKTKFGFFLLRNDSTVIRHEAQFQDVKNQLIYLATKQKWLNIDSIYNDKAFKIYKNNKLLSIVQDTFNLSIKLFPSGYQRPVMSNSASESKRSIKLCSVYLPLLLQFQLTEKYTDIKDPQKKSTEIFNKFGTWEITIHSQKPGCVQIPFKFVKQHLIDSLITQEMDSIFNSDNKKDSTLHELALAQVYRSHYLGLSGDLENQLTKDFEKKAQYKNDKSLAEKIKMAIRNYREEHIETINNWLSLINIDYDLLRKL